MEWIQNPPALNILPNVIYSSSLLSVFSLRRKIALLCCTANTHTHTHWKVLSLWNVKWLHLNGAQTDWVRSRWKLIRRPSVWNWNVITDVSPHSGAIQARKKKERRFFENSNLSQEGPFGYLHQSVVKVWGKKGFVINTTWITHVEILFIYKNTTSLRVFAHFMIINSLLPNQINITI